MVLDVNATFVNIMISIACKFCPLSSKLFLILADVYVRDRSLFTEGLVPNRNGLGERNFLTKRLGE